MAGGRRGHRRGGGARRAGAAAEEDDDEGEEADDDIGKSVTRRGAYEARRAARDAEREAQEAAQEEEIRRVAEERARKEAEEAEKWLKTFTVEAVGEDAQSQAEGEAMAERIIEYLQRRKIVTLEELAAEFGMRTSDAVTKLQTLEKNGRITGVMDDRGKYIFISREEMKAVAEFIRSRGRIAISELAVKSATLIDLEGRNVLSAEEVATLDIDGLLSNEA